MSGKVLLQYRNGNSVVNTAGANNIFGTMGTGFPQIFTNKSFIPRNDGGGTIDLTGSSPGGSPSWIGLNTKIMQFWAYVYCSPLAAVIDRLAEADVNGRISFVDEETGATLRNYKKNPKLSRINRLFKNPNPWQTWEEFDAEQLVLCKIFGYCPVFFVGGLGSDKSYCSAMINLNPIMVTPIANYGFDVYNSDSQIEKWELTVLGSSYSIPSSDVLVVHDGFISKGTDSLGLPLSKINGLDFMISNICAAQEADNVLLKKKGPLGIFSYDPGKDMAGATPLDPQAKDDLQNDLSRYGLTIGQIQYIISKMPVKWNPISFNARDLMTKETIRSGIDGICDRFAYPAELMSGKNATYENRDSAEKYLYQNNVIPFSIRRMAKYNRWFGLEGSILSKNFTHLPVLQEDIVKAGEAYKYESEGLQVEWTSGMITWNQWQTKKNRDKVEGMDIYYPDYIKKFPNMAVATQSSTSKNKNKNAKEATPKNTGS